VRVCRGNEDVGRRDADLLFDDRFCTVGNLVGEYAIIDDSDG